MVSLARKLTRLLPDAPRKRYNIFAGTNTPREWWRAARDWMSGDVERDDGAVAEYERQFARHCGAAHAISFGAGRMALYSILEALNIGDGDEVIIPAFTCVVVPNAIIYRGAHAVYVDIEARTFNIDVAQVEAAITPRTKALYAQHTFGVPCDVEPLREIGRRYNLPVIEDAAHALGAAYQGRPVGSLTEVSFFSTDHSKVINTHLGGMAVTNDPALAERIRAIQARASTLDRQATRRLLFSFLVEYSFFAPRVLWIGRSLHAILARLGLLFYFLDESEVSMPSEYPYPCRLSAAQARIGLSQLANLPANLAHRRAIAAWLEEKLRWNGMSLDKIAESTWLRYSFLVRDRARFEAAFSRNFDLGIWFTSVVSGRMQELEAVGYRSGSCPTAEYVVEHIVNFPTHPRIPLAALRQQLERNRLGEQEILYQTDKQD